MITPALTSFRRSALLGSLLFAAAVVAPAQVAFQVSVNTAWLSATPDAPLYLDFQLNDGAGLGNGNNTASITGFDFNGGSVLGAATTWGGASGDLGSSVWLTDTDAFNEFYQAFLPGSSLSFTVTLSTWVEDVPDLFSFAILDSTLANLATDAPGTDALVAVNLDASNPEIFTYSTLDGLVPAPAVVPVPEPGTYALFASLGLGLLAWRHRRASGPRSRCAE